LKGTALAGAGLWVSGPSAFALSRYTNERIKFACIGVGGKGSSDTDQAGQFGDVVALCDIDDERLAAKAEKFPDAKKYNDYRKMLDEIGGQVDAVTVSTPDHSHAPAAMMAMKMGKHVYCQKPLTHSVYEARAMREAAAKYQVATQMGNQGTAHDGFRRGVEVLQSGAIGPVHEAHVWTNRPLKYWKQAPDVVARPDERPPVPEHVHWDLFLGPAPERPYHSIYHPFGWRGWLDFGTGALGDMACHTANLAFMALKLGSPTRISAESSEVNSETFPAWATITYEFPARGDLPPVKLTWYEGARDGERNLPVPDLLLGEEPTSSGSLFVGEKGTLFSPSDYGAEQKLLPTKDFEGYQDPPERLPRVSGGEGIDDNMKLEWVRAIQGGPPATSNFDYAGMLTEAMLLGNVAIRVGTPIEWDGPNLRVTNSTEANQYLKREYRTGWTL
jgi:predicted dehydrogenase